MPARQTEKSFWTKVAVGSTNDCWEWTAACNNTGYGTVRWDGVTYVSHRVAAWLNGLVKSKLAPTELYSTDYVLHKCDNRKCCNPSHFMIGSLSDNMYDAYSKARKIQPRGANHANSKLSSEQANCIRPRYKAGEIQVHLAKEYNVSQRVISLIVRGETYI